MKHLRIVVRQLAKHPGFAAVTILTIGLCLGANLAIFAVVDAILLRPLPFPDSDRLVVMYNSYPKIGRERGESSYLNYKSRRGAIDALENVAALALGTSIVGEVGSTEATEVIRVSAEFFETLGVRPMLGRAFTESEMTYQTDAVAILTDEFWRTQFDADPAVIGRTVRVDGMARMVVGVMPPGFRFLSSRARLFLPLSVDADVLRIQRLHNSGFEMIGRLAPGASMADAQAQIDVHNASMNRDFPYAKDVADGGFRTVVATLHGEHVHSIRRTLWLLQAGVLCLLLIGGVNLANLLMIRASARTQEFAVRQALGAGRLQVLGQALTESLGLAVIGGGVGLALATAGIGASRWLGVAQLPLGQWVEVTPRVWGAGLLAALFLGVVGGLFTAFLGFRAGVGGALPTGTRSGTPTRAVQRVRQAFIVAQVAMALVLLVGAGLLGASLDRALAVSPGFRPDHVLAGRVALPWTHYRDDAARLAFIERLLDVLKSQPGVTAAGVSTAVPIHASRESNVMRIPGHEPELANPPILHNRHGVTGDYFAAMGIPLIEGRFLDASDSRRTQRVCVVDTEFARTYWPGQSALGHQVSEGPDVRQRSEWFTIVGVVGAVKQKQVTETTPGRALYLPFIHNSNGQIYVTVRTAAEPGAFAVTFQKLVRSIDPELATTDLRTMEVRIADSLVARRSPAVLAGFFASAALALAAIGTYGVLAYAVAQRQREIGVRMALGALPRQIGRHFLGLGLRVLLLGALLGGIGAVMVGRAMQSLLFEVPAFHAPTFLTALSAMGLVTLAACLVPTLRAARTDPMMALRAD
ncbi:MAG: ABC transporter permease [Verrucomicrobiales bacterium]|nr:ABC transporter permease [Verrucomicrobiales bacterium]